ncbi:hypothetical protein HMI56_000091 [Coelomomyces lativittatus]|nr:hypothetical protein HMI56_000091 [Coelomomyces lativittatus]
MFLKKILVHEKFILNGFRNPRDVDSSSFLKKASILIELGLGNSTFGFASQLAKK